MYLLKTKGFTLKKQPPPSPRQPADNRPSPFNIPEILERILSFTDERTLATAAQLVSLQWRILSKQFLHTNVELDLSRDKKNLESILPTLVPQATRLVLAATGPEGSRDIEKVREQLWDLFTEKNTRIARTGGMSIMNIKQRTDPKELQDAKLIMFVPLKELVLGRGFESSMTAFLRSALRTCSTLTRLTLYSDDSCHPPLSLGALFQSFPHLLTLELASRCGAFLLLEPGSILPEHDQALAPDIPSRLKLESVYFRGVAVSQSIVQNLLKASALHLKDLKLWNLQPTIKTLERYYQGGIMVHDATFDVPSFFKYLYGLPLIKLRSFAFSMVGQDRATTSVSEMDLGRILKDLGTRTGGVHEWGFSVEMCAKLASIANRITTLELVAEVGREGGQDPTALHAFLCQAPHLLHLKARGVRLDVRIRGGMRFYEKGKDHRWWACKGLQTLQIGLASRAGGGGGDGGGGGTDPSPAEFRVFCGYLVRVCPLVHELELTGTGGLDLGLDNGFVLLSRLQSLKRVVLELPWRMDSKKAIRLLWATLRPTTSDRIQKEASLFQWRQQLDKESREFDTRDITMSIDLDPMPQQLSWEDEKYIGTLWDIKMVLEDLEDDRGLKRCWPRLYTLRLMSNTRYFLQRTITSREPFQYEERMVNILITSTHLL